VLYDVLTPPYFFYDSTSKSFIIDHPIDNDKYLIHVCLEGPESGVYYRGKSEINNNHFVTIELPHYVKNLATDLTIQITPIYSETPYYPLQTSEVFDNKFNVYRKNGKFY
jgi:hypothetical protein